MLSEIDGFSLCKRDKPIPDESFAGYMVRLAEENDYDGPHWIMKMANFGRYSISSGYAFLKKESVDYSSLSRLIGVEEVEILSLAYPPVTVEGGASKHLVFGKPIPVHAINMKHAKICPQCLSNSSHCRRIWDLAPVTACPTHKCLLLDECPSCKQRIKWSRNSVNFCSCSFDLRNAATSKLQDIELAISQRIHQICGFSTDVKTQKYLMDRVPILKVDLEHLVIALAFFMSQNESISDTKGWYWKKPYRNSELHSYLMKALAIFVDWPNQFFQFLDWRRLKQQGEIGFRKTLFGDLVRNKSALRMNFGTFYTALYRHLSASEFDFIRIAFEEYLTNFWDGGYNHARGKRLQKQSRIFTRGNRRLNIGAIWISKIRILSVSTVSKYLFSISQRTVIPVGHLITKTNQSSPDSCIGLNEASWLLGIWRTNIRQLIDYECLQPIQAPTVDQQKRWKFSRRAVNDLLKTIESKIVKDSQNKFKNLVSFHEALHNFSRLEVGIGKFVRGILDGNLSPSIRTSKGGFAGFMFEKEKVLDYVRAELRNHRGNSFTIKEAAKLMELRGEFVYSLVNKGILPVQKPANGKKRGIRVAADSIEYFISIYVTSGELARRVGTSAALLIRALGAKGIQPTSGPKTDGGINCVFKKADVESLNLEEIIYEFKMEHNPRLPRHR